MRKTRVHRLYFGALSGRLQKRQIQAPPTGFAPGGSPFRAGTFWVPPFVSQRRVTVLARPLVEAEWEMVRAFVRRMEPGGLRLRFGVPLDFRDELTLQRAFDVKAGVGEIAWVLDETAAIAGIAHRVMVSPSDAEIAVIVRSDLKRVGIGEFLLREILARSARQGLKVLSGLVLRENRAMLLLAAKIGFVPREECALTVEPTLDLGQATAAIWDLQQ